MNESIGETVLSADQIREGIGRVAADINRDFSSAVVVTVVPGGILATADLVRLLTFDIEMDCISCPHTRADAGPGGHSGAALQSSAAGSHPHTGTSDQPQPGPAPTTLPATSTTRKTTRSRTLQPAS